MKTLKQIIENHSNKIGFVEYFETPKTMINEWTFTKIEDCICYIELLGLINTEELKNELTNSKLNTKIIGLDIYIVKN